MAQEESRDKFVNCFDGNGECRFSVCVPTEKGVDAQMLAESIERGSLTGEIVDCAIAADQPQGAIVKY